MIKKLSVLVVLMLLSVTKVASEPQIPAPAGAPSGVIALSTGTAIRLVPNPSTANPIHCNSIFIQLLANGAGTFAYVLNANPSVTVAKDGTGTTTVAQLSTGSATQAGASFTFPSNGSATNVTSGVDLRYWAVQGTTGDSVLASCDLRQ